MWPYHLSVSINQTAQKITVKPGTEGLCELMYKKFNLVPYHPTKFPALNDMKFQQK
jgi:hypothetical protein